MKNYAFIILLMCYLSTEAQVIRGRVLAFGTDSAVAHASVYFGGMHKGTISDDKGYFQLPLSGSAEIPVIVSAVGYYSATVTDYSAEKLINVYLNPKAYAMNTVTIAFDGMSREEKEKIFKREFLGTSKNASECDVVNMEDVTLIYHRKTKTLEALCDQPLLIHNKALGYNISYYLDKFTSTNNWADIAGYYFFEPDTSLTEKEIAQVNRNRKNAYLGSKMHFIRSLWNNSLDKEGYTIYDKNNLRLSYENTIVENNSEKSIQINDEIEIAYRHKQYSFLKKQESLTFIDKNGFYSGFHWEGFMAKQRIGDLLPYEYQQTASVQSPATSSIQSIITSLDTLRSRMPAEQLYLHFDKPYYHTGDTMWFKGYLLDAAFFTPSVHSGLIYVELSNEENKVLKRILLPAAGGLSRGQLPLPADEFPEGNYTIRAYTNLMRNFGESYVFKKSFYITRPADERWMVQSRFNLTKKGDKDEIQALLQFNRFDKRPVGLHEMQLSLHSGKRVLYKDNFQTEVGGRLETAFTLPSNPGPLTLVARDLRKGDDEQQLRIPVFLSRDIDLQFMPEGGHLVNGIRSVVGFKAIDQDGNSVRVEGRIYAGDQEVTSFQSIHRGMGSFELEPKPGETYAARITSPDGTIKTYPLPEVKATGTVLQVINSPESDSVEARINASADLLAAGNRYYLIGQSRGVICYGSFDKLQAESVKIPKHLFPTGIARFTLLNSLRQPLNERMTYINHHDTLQISITPEKSAYSTRDSVALRIRVTDHTGRPVQGSFSLAVTDDQQVKAEQKDSPSMASYLLLTSGLQGTVEEPGYYFQSGDPQAGQALDNLLLTQGWTGYSWQDVFTPPQTPAYAVQKEYTIRGKVESISKPIANTQVMLISKRPSLLMETLTDEQGRFTFRDLVQADTAVFLIQAKNRRGKNFNVGVTVEEFEAPVFKAASLFTPWYVNTDTTLLRNLATRADLKMQEEKLAGRNTLKEVVITAMKTVKGSKNLNGPGEADQVLDEKDMEKAGKMTLRQLLENKIEGFGIRLIKGKYKFYVIKEKIMRATIDGVFIGDASGLLDVLTAEDLKGIEVMYDWTHSASYKSRFLSTAELKISPIKLDFAFIEITTRSGRGADLKHTPGTYLHRPLSLSMPKDFYRPRYTIKQKTDLADFRSTIHWEPDIITDADGKALVSFYAADNPGSYTMVLEGCSVDGSVGKRTVKVNVIKQTEVVKH